MFGAMAVGRLLICHSGRDAAIAGALQARLSSIAATTVLDWPDLQAGSDLATSPRDAVGCVDLVIILWSEQSAQSPWVRQETQLALDAWEDGRLLLVRLDSTLPPLGLRDVECLDVSQATEQAAVELIATRIRNQFAPSALPAPAAGADRARRVRRAILLAACVLALGWSLAGLFFYGSHLEPAPAPRPSETAPTAPAPAPAPVPAPAPAPADQASLDLDPALAMVAPALVLLLIALLVWRRFLRLRRRGVASVARNMATASASPPLFVSYSHDDSSRVNELVDALQHAGLGIWLDREQNAHGRRFAGPIVEAIRGAKACAFMCSSTAYASDHVVRELYLADKYDKPMIPVRLENALPTADFEYFFSGLDFVSCDPRDQCIAAIQHRLIAIARIGNAD